MHPTQHTELMKFIISKIQHDLGIAPIVMGQRYDLNAALAKLPVDDVRKMKRKFRKLWRQAMREQQARTLRMSNARNRERKMNNVVRTYTDPGAPPAVMQRFNRRKAVADMIHNAAVPIVQKLIESAMKR